MNTRVLRADLFLLLTALLWGFGFVAQSSGMDYVGPFTYNGIRFLLGSLSLLPLLVFPRRRAPAAASGGPGALLLSTFLAGTVLFFAVGLQQIGIMFTTVGNTGFITGFYVVLTPVFGMALGKKTGLPTWLGMALALAGLYFIFLAGSAVSVNPGDLITLISAVFWACHILLIDSLVRRISPLALSAGQFAWCGLYALLAAFTLEPLVPALAARIAPGYPLQHWKPLPLVFAAVRDAVTGGRLPEGAFAAAVPVLYGGLVSVGIAYTLQVVAQKDAPPAHAVIILCLEGAFAALGGVLLRGEVPGPSTLLGFLFMLLGMFVTQWEVIRRPQSGGK